MRLIFYSNVLDIPFYVRIRLTVPYAPFPFLLLSLSLFIFPCCFESSGHLWGRKRPLGEVRCALDCECVCLWERVSLAEVSSPETAEQKGLWLTGLTFPFVLFFSISPSSTPSSPFWTPKVESVQTCSQIVEKKKNISKDSLGWEKQTPEQPPGDDGQMKKSKRERYQRQ